MGQKISTDWFRSYQKLKNTNVRVKDPVSIPKSIWFAGKRSYAKLLLQDKEIREYIENQLKNVGLVEIVIKRYVRKIDIDLYATKPGLVIGKGGSTINKLKEDLIKTFKLPSDLKINIVEFKDANKSAKVVAEEIARALQKGLSYRRIAKSYLERIRYSGILGAKIALKGRLNKAEIARAESFSFGSIPRHTIDSQIDFSLVHCKTVAGVIGIKVYLYKGDKISNYGF